MKDLLYLCHRLPYPPNKGDKIRSFHILKYLTAHWRVHLVTFIDDDNDEQYVSEVEKMCASVYIKRINTTRAKIKALSGLLMGRCFSDAYYQYQSVTQYVDALIQKNHIGTAFCYSTPMAQYVDRYDTMKRYMDFVDMDSYKWKQYAQSHQAPMRWVFATEFKRLLGREITIANRFNKTWFVTAEERQLFLSEASQRVNEHAVDWFSNGVDMEYFQPSNTFTSPFSANETAIVFTGAMDYYANADAVQWFADRVFPTLRNTNPQLRFYIVGSKPLDRVKALEQKPGITVTGRVPDVRPYLQFAALAVAPMRIARGLQNKVLEALAMNKAIIASPEALEGLVPAPELDALKAKDEQQFISHCEKFLNHNGAWRGYVEKHYQWQRNLEALSVMSTG